MKRVYIENMDRKPSDCTECPVCNADDDCWLLAKWYKTWEEQYNACPLREEDVND